MSPLSKRNLKDVKVWGSDWKGEDGEHGQGGKSASHHSESMQQLFSTHETLPSPQYRNS